MLTKQQITQLETWVSRGYDLPASVDFTKHAHRVALGGALDRMIGVLPELLRVYGEHLNAPPQKNIPENDLEGPLLVALADSCAAFDRLGSMFEDDRPASFAGPEDEIHGALSKRVAAWQSFAKRFETEIKKYPTLAWDALIENHV